MFLDILLRGRSHGQYRFRLGRGVGFGNRQRVRMRTLSCKELWKLMKPRLPIKRDRGVFSREWMSWIALDLGHPEIEPEGKRARMRSTR